jgi:hypothetical protein
MAKKKDKASEGPDSRDEKMKKIKSLVNSNSEDAAKVLKMWLSKAQIYVWRCVWGFYRVFFQMILASI